MTVDLVLVAVVIGFLLISSRLESPKTLRTSQAQHCAVYALMVMAPLVRETGMLLIVSWVVWACLRRQWRTAITGALCAVPALAWWGYVNSRTPPDGTAWTGAYPFSGLVNATVYEFASSPAQPGSRLAIATEMFATAGVWAAIIGTFRLLYSRWRGL